MKRKLRNYEKLIIVVILAWGIVLSAMWVLPKFGVFGTQAVKMTAGKGGSAEQEMPSPAGAEEGQQEVSVRVYKISRTPEFKDILPAMGSIKSNTETKLRFEVSGIVSSFNFKEGDFVNKEDVVATLDPKDAQLKLQYAQTKVKTAETDYALAEKKLNMYKKLYDIGAIIKSKLEELELEADKAKLQIESAQAEVDSANSELEKTTLYAPSDGVLGLRDVEPGEFVTFNDKVATLLDTRDVFSEVGIIEKDLDKISIGQKAGVLVDAYPNKEFTGEVESVSPQIEAKTRTRTVKIKLNNEEGQLLPGMFCRVQITSAEFSDCILVPSAALRDTNDDGTFDSVYMVTENNTVEVRPINIDHLTVDYAVIKEGLTEGEVVIVETPTEKLKDGQPVRVIETQETPSEQIEETPANLPPGLKKPAE